MKNIFLCLGALVVLSGCVSSFPLGMTKEQWESLSPEKQAEYQAQQYAIDARQREQAEAILQQRLAEARAQQEAEQERLRALYAGARYGDIVRVVIQGGALEIYGKRYPYHPVSFDIAKGERKLVAVTRAGQIAQTVDIDARLSEDGNTFYFDDGSNDQVILVNRDWASGQSDTPRQTDRSSGYRLVGATYTIKMKDLPGAPSRLIIEHKSGDRTWQDQ